MERIASISGTMFGMRRWTPLQGFAGGRPGACAEFNIHRADGSVEALDHIASVEMAEGDVFVIETPGGGGCGAA